MRLCADYIMTRLKLKSYQDTYAEAIAKYELQRGINDSKTRHKSTQQYYRDIQKLADNLKAEVVDLQQQKETEQEELRRAKKEIQTATLVKGKPLEYTGELYSEEHGRKFTTKKAGFQVLKAPTDGTRLVLAID